MRFLVKLEVTFMLETNKKDHSFKICAGTIIDMQLNWVLTAAHCVRDYVKTIDGVPTTIAYKNIRIIAGVKNTDSAANKQIRDVHYTDRRVFTHTGLNGTSLTYDAALIKLNQAFDRSPTVNEVTALPVQTINIDYNQEIRERGINCVYQSWGANTFVPDGNKWLFGFQPPIRNAEDSKIAMQGRIRLQRYDTDKGKFILSNGDEQRPIVAIGDSGAPVLCAHGSLDPLYYGSSGQGIMYLVLTSGFCYQVEEHLRERNVGCSDYGSGTDVRHLHEWILKKFSENPTLPQ